METTGDYEKCVEKENHSNDTKVTEDTYMYGTESCCPCCRPICPCCGRPMDRFNYPFYPTYPWYSPFITYSSGYGHMTTCDTGPYAQGTK